MLRLRCLEGKYAGQVLEFNKDCIVVGREIDCDLMLDDVACSRHHAKVFATDEGFAIQDLEIECDHYAESGTRVDAADRKGTSGIYHVGDSPQAVFGKALLGIMPGHIYLPGNVGIIGRSGTLGYEAAAQLKELGVAWYQDERNERGQITERLLMVGQLVDELGVWV